MVHKLDYNSVAGLRKPNLFIIGAMKSGTTYLRRVLGDHPSIFMCSPEEPSYFVDPKQLRKLWPAEWDWGLWRSEENYLRLFQSAGNATILGEASTNYTKRPLVSGIPEKIHEFNSDARFIYLLRDPVERTVSHYWHMVRFHAERRPMLEAIKSEPQYLDVSYYAMQIRPYLDLFGRDRVAILTFERLKAEPVPTIQWLFDWLSVDSTQVNVPRLNRAENVTPEVVRMATGYGAIQYLQTLRPFRMLTPLVPRAVLKTGQRLATRPVNRREVPTSEVVAFLQPIQRRQTEELRQLVGHGFPEWTTLYGTDAR
jgi:hypothetical protein